ncbi:bifunctional metallophosphatase/5'-nucleotidase [Niveibacterium terrae]|uniref:bifunctional metallophosphatase/5'-nucleotidase n=1 Tax=Niveibacterium terrae TaxID=3373598 RepID=UPI003A8CABA8
MKHEFLRRALFAASLALLSACAAAPQKPVVAVPLRLLAINDFHGQISAGRTQDSRPAGGAAVLAGWLHDAERSAPGTSLIVSSGDLVSASPLASSLLRDEPTIQFMNLLANSDCTVKDRLAPRCNIVATTGNHEFDRGLSELKRLHQGGEAKSGPSIATPWLGARFPLVSANVVDAASGQPILPPYAIKQIPYKAADGNERSIPVAFIGATLRETPAMVVQSGVAGVRFLDEADSINRYVPELHAKGIRAIVVLLHQGGRQSAYPGPTDPYRALPVGEELRAIVDRLDDEIDVVCAAHTHAFMNALIPNAHGKPILVTEAWSYSTAFAQLDLTLDPASGDVVRKTARIQPAWADAGIKADAAAAELVARAEAIVAPIANRLLTTTDRDLLRSEIRDGESLMGDLVADAQREAGHSDFSFINSGGLRNDLRVVRPRPAGLPSGAISYADAHSVQPFANSLVRMSLSGDDIYALLQGQFNADGKRLHTLYVSGLVYQLRDGKVLEVRKDGKALNRAARYTVTVANFLAEGGDQFELFKKGQDRSTVGGDLDALTDYLDLHSEGGKLVLPADEARVISE